MTKHNRNAWIGGTLYIGSALGVVPSVNAADGDPAVKVLLDQATYWHEKSHDDLAKAALQRVFQADADNITALYLMALYSSQSGDEREAEQWRRKFSAVSPNDPRLAALAGAQRLKSLAPEQLAAARKLAGAGKIREAVAAYRALFNGGDPIDSLALEYYQTMAGSPDLLPAAVGGLRGRAAALPQDDATRLALAKILTYQPATRREGSQMLAALAPGNKEADLALRQSLLWLAPQNDDAGLYQSYLARHADDQTVVDHYRQGLGGIAKQSGYSALSGGDLASAREKFAAVLKTNPNDGEALAGMGYVSLRQGDFAGAGKYLQQAAAQGGDNKEQWRMQAEDAEFYGRLNQAKNTAGQGDLAGALALSAPLAQAAGAKGLAVNLFRADTLRRQGDLEAAEGVYRSLSTQAPGNSDARAGLYFVLRQQKKTEEAQRILATLPAALRARLQPAGASVEPLRKEAARAMSAGDAQQALTLLGQAMARQPDNIWLRLDKARILQRQGESAQARALITQAAQKSGAANDTLYGAALFATEQRDWAWAQSLLTRIPTAAQTAETRELVKRVGFNRQLAIAENYLRQGDYLAASNTLRILAQAAPASPADVGNLARLMMAAGDAGQAVRLVRHNIAGGPRGTVGEYGAQIGVLNQAGLFDEADALANNPALLGDSSAQEVAGIRAGAAIVTADRLREQGNIAAAYAKLKAEIGNNPHNPDLLLAMARVYAASGMNQDAERIYVYVLTLDNGSAAAREGQINVVLAQGDVARAQRLLAAVPASRAPQYLYLAAQVAEAGGNHKQALALLRTALWRKGDNGLTAKAPAINSITDTPDIIPGAQAAEPVSLADRTRRQISAMADEIQGKIATWTRGDMAVRARNGESGLSQLNEVKAPLTLSGVPDDGSRLSLSITPVSLSAGSMSGLAANRFGTGALQHAERLAAADTDADASQTNADAPAAQQSNGVATHLTLSGDGYQADIGSTPLGADITRIVGGLRWSPALSTFGRLNLVAERRAVTDSLLSYVGVKDSNSNTTWGAVTKNGAGVQYAYDNGVAGMYAGAGYYDYVGNNIAGNREVESSAGVYTRPYRTQKSEFKVGVGIDYKDYAKNLSYYTLGQGGYFSPQDYLSIAIPMEYNHQYDNLKLGLSGSVGYQSYHQDKSAYFPNNKALQSQLEALAAENDDVDSYYSGTSKNGVGYTLKIDADYKVNEYIHLGGRVGYDTFGKYSEGTGSIYFKYLLDEK
ncbi:cellulose biosynthesis protein BcsC [Acerihabitans arboris]|uniref:Tetratricopeptide repeat protein n=1 Tax=Acerihabitans arboris TaxID=2691583 RepID=A0A845SGD9_9GAMM|nr:cellulose biosynthesis protein BcsC [Acerihabitans arboris]NDL61691.1 tetratricopeptide repeat protein [Acerihabitans arboris]